MKKASLSFNLTIALTLASLLSACTTESPAVKPTSTATPKSAVAKPAPAAAPVLPEKAIEQAARTAAQAELDSGIALYNNGDYHGAIKRFGIIEDNLKPYKDLELQAFKYTAFSWCVTGHVSLCKVQFERAIKLDPSFDLEPGEKGHPLWGPVFERVKKGSN